MASATIIDISSLLEPISEENPVGSDIREDPSPASPYYTIKDARNSARSAERNSMFDGGSNEADDNWRKVLQLAPDILKNNAKDLEIASWYLEALIRRHGFQGLRDGFALIRKLIEDYWDEIYPLPDDEGIETRVASLTGLNGEGAEGILIAPIRNALITEDQHPGPYNLWQYQQALDVQNIIDDDARAEKADKLGFTLEDIENTVAKSSDTFYIDLRDDISSCLADYREISRLLDEYCGINDAPPTSNIINTLTDTLGVINHIAKYKFPVEVVDDNGELIATGESGDGQAMKGGAISSRAEAFRNLSSISEFFRKTEPHSPISYVLEKTVKWGDMSLSELMRELIPDATSRGYYASLTGIKSEDE